MRALSSTGWTEGAANYDGGLEAHTYTRPAPRRIAPLSGLGVKPFAPSPSPVNSSLTRRAAEPRGALPLYHARYDALNRITSAAEAVLAGTGVGFSRSWSYDAKGNMAAGGGSLAVGTPTSLGQYDGQTNQLKYFRAGLAAADVMTYDANGNLTERPADIGPGRTSYQWDGENRLKTVNGGGLGTFSYDAAGRRVKRVSGGSTVRYYYDAAGELQMEVEEGSTASPGVRYLTVDHLGSTRVVTRGDGFVLGRYDYEPFGAEVATTSRVAQGYAGDPGLRVKFTGKERDAETGLDYFGARYMSAAQGRFTSPDKPFADQTPIDPQSWNLYSYVRNNPVKNTDPDGEACVVGPNGKEHDDNSGGQSCADAHKKSENDKPSVTVNAQQGSLWDYLTTTVPRYVPNDTELPSGARNVLSKVYQNTWVIAQPVCSGGGFVFVGGGGNIPGTKIHAEGYFLPVDYESGKGFSSGVLGEVGIGHTPFAVGGEASVNWKTGQKSYAGLGFANKDVGGLKAGAASLGLLADTHGNVGGYASLAGVGVGVYGRPSFINGCPAN